MKKFFLHIYLVLVVTIVISGLILNVIWNRLLDEEDRNLSQQLFETSSVLVSSAENRERALTNLNEINNGTWALVDESELAIASELSESFAEGSAFSFVDDENQVHWFKRLSADEDPDNQLYLHWQPRPQEDNVHWVEKIFIVIFYCSIGLVLFISLKPFSREIKRFSWQVKRFGESNWQHRLEVKDQSLFKEFAESFNDMANRIEDLVKTQKELSHAVSHELRTPLARMKFALEEMSSPDATPEHKVEHEQQIKSDIAQLETLINELLDYAEFDSKHYHLNRMNADICEVTRSIIENHKTYSQRQWQFHCNEPINLSLDWHLYERMINNLLVNAEKFSNSQIAVSIRKDKSQVIITVEDDGPGIPESLREKVFQSFYKAKANNIASKGFGLGLAIVHRIVRLHNGSITVGDSELGGCRFVVSVPTRHPMRD